MAAERSKAYEAYIEAQQAYRQANRTDAQLAYDNYQKRNVSLSEK